ncbi:MAG: RNA polymerase factor sigma-54, partial [Treponema sp.]|nr:RNA polymerase factor sigma-54 [Treponema sp.]
MQLQRPSFVQEQRLKMNPQMLLSIKLMGMPITELRERIEQELEKNPALELIDDKSTVPLEEYKNVKTISNSTRKSQQVSDEHRRFIEGTLTRSETLQEHLLRQLQLEPVDKKLRIIAETLIQNLNDDGFHKEKPQTLFAEEQPGLTEAIKLVQRLDPIGCCTNNYKESLQSQITLSSESMRLANHRFDAFTRDNLNNFIEKILDELELLEREKYSVLAKKIGLDEEDTRDICDFLKTLSPYPGRAFVSMSNEVRYVIPDIKVERDNDEFTIKLNDDVFPVLGISSNFEKFGESKDAAARNFARENIREARLFINHLSQRNQTLIRVANAILEFQRSFFLNGPKSLAPLTLSDIAKELDVHETTVSRTANGKYMQTEWGIYEIRYFFTNS